MFFPVSLSGDPNLKVMGLAPMSVAPRCQGKGIGSALVRAGLEYCLQRGIDAVVVLGYPEFYTRFGFLPSSRFGIESEYDVPEEVFMVMELRRGALHGEKRVRRNTIPRSVKYKQNIDTPGTGRPLLAKWNWYQLKFATGIFTNSFCC